MMESREIKSLITTGQYDKAVNILKEQEVNFGETERNYLLGYAYRLQGRTEEAIRHYIKTIKNDYDCFPAIRELSSLLVENGYKREAINLLNTILGDTSNNEFNLDKNEMSNSRQYYETNYKVVAIHQPYYFPWLGFFHKIFYSDVFVVLDDVQIGNRSLVNRVEIRTPNGKNYLRIPLKNHSRNDLINSVYPLSDQWKENNISLLQFYKKSPYFDKYYPAIETLIKNCDCSKAISEIDIYLIKEVCNILNIDVQIVKSSDLNTSSRKAGLMIEITKSVGGNVYLSGLAAKDYQNAAEFEEAGISLIYQDIYDFIAMNPYSQSQGDFINGLSVLDALFNIGVDEIVNIFKNYEDVLFTEN